jgi:hypothetical protein
MANSLGPSRCERRYCSQRIVNDPLIKKTLASTPFQPSFDRLLHPFTVVLVFFAAYPTSCFCLQQRGAVLLSASGGGLICHDHFLLLLAARDDVRIHNLSQRPQAITSGSRPGGNIGCPLSGELHSGQGSPASPHSFPFISWSMGRSRWLSQTQPASPHRAQRSIIF